MKTLLLAAGRSTRLSPLGDKNFFGFCGKALVAHQISTLLGCGIREIILVGNAGNIGKLRQFESDSISVVEQKDLDSGMQGAVLACADLIKDDSVLIVSGNDIVEEMAYKSVLMKAQDENIDGVLLAKKVSRYFPGGYLELSDDGRIGSIIEKPGEGNEPGDVINLVVHYHKNAQNLLSELRNSDSEKDDLYEVAIDKLFQNFSYHAAIYDGSWLTIKYPWHVLHVMNQYLSSLERDVHTNVHIAETAVINGNVVIEEGVKVFDNAVIQGPCYIGKNSIVANNSLVRGSMIGENCVVGYSTEIARSYLGNDVWTHTNYVGDSVIDSNVSLGSGTVTGNLRLDEKEIPVNVQGEKVMSGLTKFGSVIGAGVRVGINVSLLPGIRIGSNSFIAGGVLIQQDIPDNSFVRARMELKITENRVSEAPMDRGSFFGGIQS